MMELGASAMFSAISARSMKGCSPVVPRSLESSRLERRLADCSLADLFLRLSSTALRKMMALKSAEMLWLDMPLTSAAKRRFHRDTVEISALSNAGTSGAGWMDERFWNALLFSFPTLARVID